MQQPVFVRTLLQAIDYVYETVECFACALKSAFVYKSTSSKKIKA